jgi:hypothetical protein
MKNSAIQKIRRTAGRPLLTRRREQLKVAIEDLARKLAPLGINFAGVFMDTQLQGQDNGGLTLGFGANVSQEAGNQLLETFLAMSEISSTTRTVLSGASPAAPAESKAIDAVIETLASTYIPENVTN